MPDNSDIAAGIQNLQGLAVGLQKLKKFVGNPENGVDNFSPDLSPQLAISDDSKNLTTGINQGIGPRYGMSPIPNHSQTVTNDSTTCVGLQGCEAATPDYSYISRLKVMGVFPILEYFPEIGVTGPQNYFAWIVGNDTDGTSNSLNKFDVVLSSFKTTSDFVDYVYPQADIAAGTGIALTNPLVFNGGNYDYLDIPYARFPLTGVGSSTLQTVIAPLFSGFTKYYMSAVSVSVSGSDIPAQWLLGGQIAAPGNSSPGTYAFNKSSSIPMGSPSSINLAKYPNLSRAIKIYRLYADPTWGLALAYSYHYKDTPTTSGTYIARNDNSASVSFDPTTLTGTLTKVNRQDGVTPAFVDSNSLALHNDTSLTTNTSYKAILAAGKKPVAMVVQGWARGKYGYPFQVCDLTNNRLKPRSGYTGDSYIGYSTEYTEDTIRTQTCWNNWPTFTSSGSLESLTGNPRVSLTISASNGIVTLGPADSGVLRKNTTYEITYSVYDKFLGCETNVGKPAKFRTASEDNVAITLYRDVIATGSYKETCAYFGAQNAIFRGLGFSGSVSAQEIPINRIEFRVYYRELGSFEWLPALFMDASQYFFYPEFGAALYACQAPIAALPGGQPGGFIDYSELPVDEYNCVVYFKNRAFWLSATNMIFSLQNNVFAYPLRNSTPAPTGGYRGAIVHTYRGQSDQQSRLVIFGGKETYIGIFTGQFQQQPVVVSPDTIASYDVDGSDFRVETWTSITAFSHRSAVVADGDLYWWGPQGVYMDNGVGNPVKVSGSQEPDIFTIFDQQKTDEIHCTYNEKTKEIIWFYPPIEDNTITKAMVYSTRTQEFFYQTFGSKIDWAQSLNTATAGTSQKTNGYRTVIGVRETSAQTTQRAYFFDSINRAGDIKPKTEFLVKTIASGAVTGQKVLTLAAGYDATNFNTIVANDYFAIQQFKNYTGQATGDDMITKVISTNSGAGTITVRLPEGAVLPNVTITDGKLYAPIWHRGALTAGLNGITWMWRTKYWMPGGTNFWGIWKWLYLLFKYQTWKKIDPLDINIAYRTPQGGDYVSDSVRFADNSDGNFQLFHALRTGKMNNQGQAIKFSVTGIHIGEEWVLQYLEAHSQMQEGNLLKLFQG